MICRFGRSPARCCYTLDRGLAHHNLGTNTSLHLPQAFIPYILVKRMSLRCVSHFHLNYLLSLKHAEYDHGHHAMSVSSCHCSQKVITIAGHKHSQRCNKPSVDSVSHTSQYRSCIPLSATSECAVILGGIF